MLISLVLSWSMRPMQPGRGRVSVARNERNFSSDQKDLFQRVESIRPAVKSIAAPDFDIELEVLAAL